MARSTGKKSYNLTFVSSDECLCMKIQVICAFPFFLEIEMIFPKMKLVFQTKHVIQHSYPVIPTTCKANILISIRTQVNSLSCLI